MDKNQLCFILYKAAVPENIGASARAIKTMGFSELRLINCNNHLNTEARMLAHGSHDILENASTFHHYEDAFEDLDFIISTSAKKKSAKVDYITPNELKDVIREKSPLTKRIGIVFGSEESGLPNEIIQRSNLGLSIPMQTTYPSLNLSQSVMLIAYELSKTSWQSSPEDKEKLHPEAWKQLEERSREILNEAGIKTGTPLFHRILERMSFLKASDARLVHSISSKIKELLH